MAQDDADDRGEFGVAYLRYVPRQPKPRGQAVAVVQYALLVCVLFGRAGSLAMQASLK